MNKWIFICIGAILLIFYFTSQVPYCKISEDSFTSNVTLYTSRDISEIGEIYTTQLRVIGTSMLPTIQDNSQCLCVKKESYNVGDIILFFADINGKFLGIAHRIVAINSEKIITKGDNNPFLDSPMTKNSIICSIPEIPRWRIFT